MKAIATAVMILGAVLAYASELAAFIFAAYKYTQGHSFWICVLYGLLAEVVFRVTAFTLIWIGGATKAESSFG